MDSSDLTCVQCRQMHASLFRLVNYLHLVKQRMERRGFPLDDPLYLKSKSAYDSVCSLLMELHYMGCESGVGRPPRK